MPAQLTFDAVDEAEKAVKVDPMEQARRWREENAAAWQMLRTWAFQDHVAGRRASIGFYAELLRRPEYYKHLTHTDDSPYLINNSIRSALVRLLIEECPRLAGAFETRRSKLDPLGAASTWQGVTPGEVSA